MIGQRRNILATMGVDVWIPRHVAVQKNTKSSLWRDQSVEQYDQPLIPISAKENIEHTPKDSSSEPILVQPDVIEIVQQPIQNPVTKQHKTIDLEISSTLSQFRLEAFVLRQSVLLVETTTLSDAERKLWTNIQSALSGTYTELNWPFPLLNFRDNRGVGAYVQGFLDALTLDKKILCLGQIEFVRHAQLMPLASLAEMLEQPILKKRLWTLMQSA
ncbi:hypothetical protein [Acinetobacter baylyi]|uniref:hypothetical protein n=1 Tax=Acinetobacter baylyi TaxID=202950 RepID=UPI0031CFDC98